MMLSDTEKRARLEKALRLAGPTHSVDHVVERIKAGDAQFWENDEGAIVTELYDFPLRKSVQYWLVAGKLDACLALQPDIEGWARGVGCTHATAIGRQGWQPILTRHGWRLCGLEYVKDLPA